MSCCSDMFNLPLQTGSLTVHAVLFWHVQLTSTDWFLASPGLVALTGSTYLYKLVHWQSMPCCSDMFNLPLQTGSLTVHALLFWHVQLTSTDWFIDSPCRAVLTCSTYLYRLVPRQSMPCCFDRFNLPLQIGSLTVHAVLFWHVQLTSTEWFLASPCLVALTGSTYLYKLVHWQSMPCCSDMFNLPLQTGSSPVHALLLWQVQLTSTNWFIDSPCRAVLTCSTYLYRVVPRQSMPCCFDRFNLPLQTGSLTVHAVLFWHVQLTFTDWFLASPCLVALTGSTYLYKLVHWQSMPCCSDMFNLPLQTGSSPVHALLLWQVQLTSTNWFIDSPCRAVLTGSTYLYRLVPRQSMPCCFDRFNLPLQTGSSPVHALLLWQVQLTSTNWFIDSPCRAVLTCSTYLYRLVPRQSMPCCFDRFNLPLQTGSLTVHAVLFWHVQLTLQSGSSPVHALLLWQVQLTSTNWFIDSPCRAVLTCSTYLYRLVPRQSMPCCFDRFNLPLQIGSLTVHAVLFWHVQLTSTDWFLASPCLVALTGSTYLYKLVHWQSMPCCSDRFNLPLQTGSSPVHALLLWQVQLTSTDWFLASPCLVALTGSGEVSKHKVMTLSAPVDNGGVVDMRIWITALYFRVVWWHQNRTLYP